MFGRKDLELKIKMDDSFHLIGKRPILISIPEQNKNNPIQSLSSNDSNLHSNKASGTCLIHGRNQNRNELMIISSRILDL